MINRLRRRFILVVMTSMTLVIVVLSLSVNLINFLSINADLNRMLELLCENQGALPEIPRGGRPDRIQGFPITPETPYSTRYFVIWYNADGDLTNADMRHIAAVTEDDVDAYLAVALRSDVGFGYSGSYKFYVSSTGDGGYMAIFLECRQELRAVCMFALISVLVVVVCIVLVYLLVLLLSKRAIDPVVRNAERQKQFITDASHELKTPLTVIRTCLKVLEMEVGQQKWIDKAQAQADRMGELVGDLVTLSRLDEEKPALRVALFSLSEAVAETVESFRDFAGAEGHALETELAPELRIRGDEYAIRQLVAILLDNAVKYAAEGSAIGLRLARVKRGAVLTMRNACTGLDCAELDRLFDRFYRVEKSRSKQTGGFGIGLSIARSIAEAHRGSIKAACPEPDVIEFTVFLRE